MSNTFFPFPPLGNHYQFDFVYYENFFTHKECEKVIKLGKSLRLEDASIINDQSSELDQNYRKSKTSFIDIDQAPWVYQKLSEILLQMNDHYYGFNLWGFTESLQFTEYNAPDGMYNTHIDCIPGQMPRKLSFIVQLSDENLYQGGDVELMIEVPPRQMLRSRGTLLVFPSYLAHRVTPVINGTRHSLVGWVSGKPFT